MIRNTLKSSFVAVKFSIEGLTGALRATFWQQATQDFWFHADR